jgi:hypothetical protein
MRHAVILCCVLLAGNADATPGGVAPGPDQSHDRLSGIISIDGQHSIAVIESPDGGFVTVREGDTFAGGRVMEISKMWLRVHFARGDKLYWLTASGFKITDVEPPANDKTVIHKGESGPALLRTLAKGPAVDRLDALIAADTGKKQTLDQLLGRVLDLPKQANIVAIDHNPLGTTKESIAAIREALAHGNVVSLSISGDPGKEMVYLTPSDANDGDGAGTGP